MSVVIVLKATPRPKPRAFPRTNPSYISSHRDDGYSTYRRIGDAGSSSRIQRVDNLSVEENPYSVLSELPSTRQHRPVTSHSFDISDSLLSAAAVCPSRVSLLLLMFTIAVNYVNLVQLLLKRLTFAQLLHKNLFILSLGHKV